jgi:hypothetical protein
MVLETNAFVLERNIDYAAAPISLERDTFDSPGPPSIVWEFRAALSLGSKQIRCPEHQDKELISRSRFLIATERLNLGIVSTLISDQRKAPAFLSGRVPAVQTPPCPRARYSDDLFAKEKPNWLAKFISDSPWLTIHIPPR